MLAEYDQAKVGERHHKQIEAPLRIESRHLLGNRQKLIIEHKGMDYCLSLTSQNKLILTK